MSVSDNGTGVPGTQVERVFFPKRPQVGRLALLRRQLKELFGKSFKLEICSEIGAGTTASLSLPLKFQVGCGHRAQLFSELTRSSIT